MRDARYCDAVKKMCEVKTVRFCDAGFLEWPPPFGTGPVQKIDFFELFFYKRKQIQRKQIQRKP